MKRFWLSWYTRGELTYDGPWWISGYTTDADGSDVAVVCAAVEAVSEVAAKRAMESASSGGLIEWRFCTEKPEDWDPFCDRFPRTDAMVWGAK